MMKFLKFVFAAALFSTLMVSCSKEESDSSDSAELFARTSTTELQERSGSGFGGCFELVFPITIKFADGTTATVDSAKAIKSAIKTWKQANPDVSGRPSFVFPISVVKSDGTVIEVENETELRDLRKECPRKFGPKHGGGEHCFKLNFPFKIKKADGTEVTINSLEDMKKLKGKMRGHNGKHPELVFPVSITLKDGTVKSIATKEELKAVKDACN